MKCIQSLDYDQQRPFSVVGDKEATLRGIGLNELSAAAHVLVIRKRACRKDKYLTGYLCRFRSDYVSFVRT
jgi:hypothetical protein